MISQNLIKKPNGKNQTNNKKSIQQYYQQWIKIEKVKLVSIIKETLIKFTAWKSKSEIWLKWWT